MKTRLKTTRKDSIMKAVGALLVFQVTLFLVIAVSWCGNLYKLTQCDFEPSYKGEIIHAVGLIPFAAPVTVWFDDK